MALLMLCGCSAKPSDDNKTGQIGPTEGQCVVSGGSNSGAVTQNCQVAPKLQSPFLGRLQRFWDEGYRIRHLLDSPDMTDSDIDRDIAIANNWADRVHDYLAKNVTPMAADMFIRTHIEWGKSDYPLNGQHKPNYAKTRSNAMFAMDQFLDNLDYEMKSPEMYP